MASKHNENDTSTVLVTPTPVNNLTVTVPISWKPEIYPNPQTDPHKCGRSNKPSFVCDPNNIISESEGEFSFELSSS